MKKLLELLSVSAISATAIANVGFLSATSIRQQKPPASIQNTLSDLDTSKINNKESETELLILEAEENNDHFRKGTLKQAQEALTKLIAQFHDWFPGVEEDVDYTITYRYNGSWIVKEIKGGMLEFDDYIFNVVVDISQLELITIDADSPLASKRLVEQTVATAIGNLVEGAVLDRDYIIPGLHYNLGRLDRVGIFKVEATEISNLLIGSFEIKVTKTIDTSNYETSGSKAEGEEILSGIVKEFKQWNPAAVEGIDYEVITTENGSWTINSLPSSLVKVNFDYEVSDDISEKINISELNLILDIDSENATKQKIEASVAELIDNLVTGAQLGVDYEIAPIPYANNRPTQIGNYLVTSLQDSKLTGEFKITLTKTIDTSKYQASGSIAQGEEILSAIVKEFKQWNPDAVEGVDYQIITQADESWTISSLPTSLVKVNFAYEVVRNDQKGDLTGIKEIVFDVNDVNVTKTYIEATVAAAIANFVDGAQLGVDYTIAKIPYNTAGRPTRVGRFEVKALPNSQILTGRFFIRLSLKIGPQEI